MRLQTVLQIARLPLSVPLYRTIQKHIQTTLLCGLIIVSVSTYYYQYLAVKKWQEAVAACHVSLWGHPIPDQPPEEGRKSFFSRPGVFNAAHPFPWQIGRGKKIRKRLNKINILLE